MNYVFSSSHLPEENRPLDVEEEDDDVQPMLRAGGVRAFSHQPQRVQREPAAPRPPAATHLPSWITESPQAEAQADPDSPGDSAPPATTGSDKHGSIGPVSPRGAAPPAGRSLFLTPRPMPPEYARQMATTYGSAHGSRGYGSSLDSGDKPAATGSSTGKMAQEKVNEALGKDGKTEAESNPTVDRGSTSNPGSGNPPAATAPSTRQVSIPEFLAQGRIAQDNYKKKVEAMKTEAGAEPTFKAEPTVEALEAHERAMEKDLNDENFVLHQHLENTKNHKELRDFITATGRAQDFAKKRMPKHLRKLFDELNHGLGLSPEQIIEKIDARLRELEKPFLEQQEKVGAAEGKWIDAKRKTEAAKYQKKKRELEEKQRQTSRVLG